MSVDVALLQKAVTWGCANSLAGESYCLTGPMSLTRADLNSVIEALGGEAHDSVKKSTQYLVIPQEEGFRQGSKYRAAMQQGVTIITEEQLAERIMPSIDQLV